MPALVPPMGRTPPSAHCKHPVEKWGCGGGPRKAPGQCAPRHPHPPCPTAGPPRTQEVPAAVLRAAAFLPLPPPCPPPHVWTPRRATNTRDTARVDPLTLPGRSSCAEMFHSCVHALLNLQRCPRRRAARRSKGLYTCTSSCLAVVSAGTRRIRFTGPCRAVS